MLIAERHNWGVPPDMYNPVDTVDGEAQETIRRISRSRAFLMTVVNTTRKQACESINESIKENRIKRNHAIQIQQLEMRICQLELRETQNYEQQKQQIEENKFLVKNIREFCSSEVSHFKHELLTSKKIMETANMEKETAEQKVEEVINVVEELECRYSTVEQEICNMEQVICQLTEQKQVAESQLQTERMDREKRDAEQEEDNYRKLLSPPPANQHPSLISIEEKLESNTALLNRLVYKFQVPDNVKNWQHAAGHTPEL